MPMSRVGLAWSPYIPDNAADSVVLEKTPIPVYTLAWKERKAQISKYDEYKMHYFQYLNPCMCSTFAKGIIDFKTHMSTVV